MYLIHFFAEYNDLIFFHHGWCIVHMSLPDNRIKHDTRYPGYQTHKNLNGSQRIMIAAEVKEREETNCKLAVNFDRSTLRHYSPFYFQASSDTRLAIVIGVIIQLAIVIGLNPHVPREKEVCN